MKADDAKALKLAKILRIAFDMRFGSSRKWEDLPAGMQEEYLGAARDVIRDMRNPEWRE